MKKILDIISAIPIFNGLPDDQIAAIKKIALEKPVSKGEIIFSEGDEGKGFFIVAEGRVGTVGRTGVERGLRFQPLARLYE